MNSPLFFASTEQRKAVENMHTCRTAARGGRIVQCPNCYTRTVVYNPCNTRLCNLFSVNFVQSRSVG
ncbi:transposase zinc-binding domain-containing protein [Teretinema zuelzerae]